MTNNTLETAVSKKEHTWVFFFAAIVLAATTVPYLVGFIRQGPDWTFTGFLFGVEDGNSYIAKMLLGSSGEWLFRTPYTAYPQQGVVLFLPYILLGKLAAAPGLHEQMVAIYHLFRIAAGFLAILATYDFIALFIAEAKWRRTALVLTTLGGGLGWIRLFGLSEWFGWGLPLESYSPEAFGFLSIFGLPHLAAARALLLWALRDFLLLAKPLTSLRGWAASAVIWFGLWFFQPISVVVGSGIVGIYIAFTGTCQLLMASRQTISDWQTWKNYIWHGVRIFALSAPLASYSYFSIRLDPVLQTWEAQNIIASPPPLTYLLAYGIILPLAILGIQPLLRDAGWAGKLLVGWLIMFPLLAYAPVGVQRRLTEGIWVALSILAVFWISTTGSRLRKPVIGWLALAFPTTLMLLAAGLLFAWNPSKPLFRPSDEVAAFQYLAGSVQTGDVVLAADDSANALPAWAPVRSLLGHGPESINGPALRPRVACFYSGSCTDVERINLLEEFNVDYVLWGPGERELGSWDPQLSPNLEQVFKEGNYAIFRYAAESQ